MAGKNGATQTKIRFRLALNSRGASDRQKLGRAKNSGDICGRPLNSQKISQTVQGVKGELGHVSRIQISKVSVPVSGVEERYRTICRDFDTLVTYGIQVSAELGGRETPHDREYYADRIFSKLLCHAITLKHIVPTGLAPVAARRTEIWDISSACAITRALLEAYDALAYVAIEDVQTSEREFRILLWKLHSEERRQKMLRLIGSTAPGNSDVDRNVTELRQKLTSHEFFNSADAGLKTKVQNSNVPPFYLSHADRNKRGGVNHEYYTAAKMFLSSYVHTYPFSVHQLMEFRAGDPESLRLMSLPVQYASGFLAKGIDGMSLVLGDAMPSPSDAASELLSTWIEIIGHGISRVG